MSSTKEGRLVSIDALRGIAAIAVMLIHAFDRGIFNPALQPFKGFGSFSEFLNHILLLPVSFGWTGVYLFFVISGFCIHLRWVKKQLRGESGGVDFISFWKRRVRRLYPAYLAALVCYIAYDYFNGTLELNSFFVWDVVSHLLMIHNLDSRTVYTMNDVFWTLAIEEQLYLLYFLLLWLRVKFGWKKTLAICFLARIGWFGFSLVIFTLFDVKIPVSESSLGNWVIWALGAVSIEAASGLIKLPKYCYSLLLMSCLFLAAAVIYWLDWLVHVGSAFHNFTIIFGQVIWGAAFFILLNRIVSLEGTEFFAAHKANNAFQRTIAVLAYIGLFSYSLYLMHMFVFSFIPEAHWTIKAVSSIAFAWLFYLVFEKPFMPKPITRVKAA